ncbi:3-hydroxyacyl-CoA dehydrogenase [Arthrobacter sp. MYb214]|uniref:3-hydroxyacyl-CoA dehydrogenase NAD-binding domain-containing protein n=1 Tax=unclassified Arthrobacter TaxID=235627 RepID=UPI000CFB5C2D|nr:MULTISPECIES: 3-hydroxyacyl-CoA dehydrogenase NAD-binding domain-containing protein [unclassified Arthrobacter]PQZ89216.1 3-hydroxyacyl-CoA dehydrogenase [Arthrobacter sp. MYb222]PRB78526.1 3-hydroxyacyl-CoA dehydrogenase [Arthrobacter sp. MYb214]
MTAMSKDFQAVAQLMHDETVTHTFVKDVALPSGKTMALLTLDNGLDHKKPTTLGPNGLLELRAALEVQAERAKNGEIDALAITGKPYFLIAGADLSAVTRLSAPDQSTAMASLGHYTYELLADLGVPTFAFINGLALGGGLEIALACNYRTVSTAAGALGLPEGFLGLIPGWAGVYRLPRLVGPENALKVMIENPLNSNRTLSGPAAAKMGVADALFEPADFIEHSIAFADGVISGTTEVKRPNAVDPTDPEVARRWLDAADAAEKFVDAKLSGAAPAPYKVLEVFRKGLAISQQESAVLEVEALTGLMSTPQFQNTVYAFLDLVQKRGKRPAGAPDPKLARPVTKVGVVGAGLMAGQLALLFARRLNVPVVITDLDQSRVDKGLAYIHGEIDKLHAKGRMSQDAVNRTKALVTGSVTKKAFADADFVIEAVFEELNVKKQVFAEVEAVVSPECILATNTSSLSVTEMGRDLSHPERLVGFHFFNPVAVMPLLEIAATEWTNDSSLSTAFVLGKKLKKTTVKTKDSAAFVVNRVLLRLMSEVQAAFDEGTDAKTADSALTPMGLPMSPLTLLAMVGLPVAQHVNESLNAAFGERFAVSENLQKLIDAKITALWVKDEAGNQVLNPEAEKLMAFGDQHSSKEQILARVQDALAEEIGLLLDEGVVAEAADVDLCMITGAGWPMHLGGITPYLDQVGASERVNGKRFNG